MFLYIDILGFSDMIKGGFPVADLYERIDQLSVHRDKDFTTIVFSDTIVVYGSEAWNGYQNQAVMWLVEFAQDLFFRLIGIDKHFRAFVTRGEFYHEKMKNIEAYYGMALVRCHEAEKAINACGVFMDRDLVPLSDVFPTTPYNDEWAFTHIAQGIGHLASSERRWGKIDYPIDSIVTDGFEHMISYETQYLRAIQRYANDATLPHKVRDKYKQTWDLIADRNGNLLAALKEADFNLHNVFPGTDWDKWMARVGTEDGFFG
jgi:hypothetical protein